MSKNLLRLYFLSILLLIFSALHAQQKKRVTGTVFDETNKRLTGVSVNVKGTGIGSVTDSEGKFSFDVNESSKTLEMSFVGMEKKEVTITTKPLLIA